MAEEGYKVDNIQDLPVEQRRKTDVFCTIINSVFVGLLFIIFLFTLNVENLRKITYPNDSQGRLCGYDDPQYPYLYFTSPTDTSKRLCVAQCPVASDTALICKPTSSLGCKQNTNPKYQVTIYDSILDQSRIGLICMPTDQQLKDQILTKSNTKSKYQFLGFYDTLWRSIWISLIFGFSISLFAYFQPYIAVPWVIFIGGIVSIIFGLLILILANGYFIVKLLLFIFFVGLGVISFLTIFNSSKRESIYICARLMHAASILEYEKSYTQLPEFFFEGVKKLLKPFLLVLSFMVLFGAFLILICFQILSAWSCARLVFVQEYPFYQVEGFGSGFLMFLIVIQFIWGMSFLKQAFNFIVSSYSTHKYFTQGNESEGPLNKREPSYLTNVELLLRYHWGSVVGGSLLLGFFHFIDIIVNFVHPQEPKVYQQTQQREPIGVKRDYEQKQGCSANTVGLFNIIREDSFAYTFLTSQPYCVSSRYCDYLGAQSKFYDYNQSINRLYRVSIHIIPIFFTLMIGMITMQNAGSNSPYGIFAITLITFFTITYPLAYQADAAEGMLISTFIELGFNDENTLERAPEIIRVAYEEDLTDTYKHETNENGEVIQRPWHKLLTHPIQTQ